MGHGRCDYNVAIGQNVGAHGAAPDCVACGCTSGVRFAFYASVVCFKGEDTLAGQLSVASPTPTH